MDELSVTPSAPTDAAPAEAAPVDAASAPATTGAVIVDPEAPAASEATDQTSQTVATSAPAADSNQFLEFFDPQGLPYAIAVIAATVVLVRLVNRLTERLAERVVKRRLFVKQIATFFAFGAYGGAMIWAAATLFNLSQEAIFALSGTLAVAGGLALKDFASAFMAGITILTNKPFQVGDRISFGGYYGEVTEIGLRTVRLVTLDDNLVTIPSNKFLTDPVASANAGALDCMVVIPFYLEPSVDIRRAKSIARDAVHASRYLYLGKPVVVLLSSQLSETGRALIVIHAKAYVYDARYERAFASDVTERALEAFAKDGIRLAGA